MRILSGAARWGSAVIGSLLETERLILRPLELDDRERLLSYVLDNESWLAPWEPAHPEPYFTLEGQGSILQNCEEDRRNGSGVLLGIFERGDRGQRLYGRISISGMVRGIWQNGFVGYSIAAERDGQGYMTEALKRVVRFGFTELELHRLQASIIPRNKGSLRVLEKCRFRYEGRALRYLKINNVWEDHDLFALTSEEVDLEKY